MRFGLENALGFAPRYNIAPLSEVPIVRADLVAARRGERARRGLVQRWAREAGIASHLINARAETLARKPASRDAFPRRRCLVAANGSYERKTEDGRKQR